MTDVSVREYAPFPSVTGDILAGAGVKAQTMRDLAVLMNSLAGRGMQLVPFQMLAPPNGLGSGFNNHGQLDFWFRPRHQAVERIWVAIFENGGAACRLRIDGENLLVLPHGGAYDSSLYVIRQPLASQSSTGADVSVIWGPTGAGSGPKIHAIGCWEIPRRLITDSTPDRGTVANRFDAGQAVQREDFDNIMSSLSGESFELGRRTLLSWATDNGQSSVSGTNSAESTSSATYVDLFDLSVPVLTRKRLVSDTQRQIVIKVLAWMDAGSGSIQAVTDSGNTSPAVAITSTSADWYTLLVDVDCTDVDSDDGRQTAASPGWDGLQIEFKADGVNTIYVASVSAYEESDAPLLDLSEGTFTRASVASYWDGTSLERYASGELRVVYQNGRRGYVIEEERTNYVTNCSDLTSSDWGAFGGGAPTPTYGVTGPDSEASASSLSFGTSYGWIRQALDGSLIPDNTIVSVSILARAVSGAHTPKLSLRRRDATFTSKVTISGTDWARYEIRNVDVLAGASAPLFYIDSTAGADGVLEVAECQVEIGGCTTSPITTGDDPVTREADDLVVAVGSSALDDPWTYYYQPFADADERASGDVSLMMRHSDGGGDAFDVRLMAGTSPVDAMVYDEASTPGLTIVALQYSALDMLNVTVDPDASSLRFTGMNKSTTEREDLVGAAFTLPAGDFRPIVTATNPATGWISDIYPAP